jgi:hypothetical protein
MYRKKTFWQIIVLTCLLIVMACSPTFFPGLNDEVESEREAATERAATAGKTRSSVSTAPKLEGEFAAGAVLQQLFGNYDAATKRARWQPGQAALQELAFNSQPRMVYTRVLFSGRFVEREQTRAILLLKTLPVPEGCRGCTPAIGAALYTKFADGWQLDAQRLNVAKVGAFDQISKAKLVRFGADKYGVLFNWKFTNLGFIEEGALLVAEYEQGLQPLLSINTGGNNAARCQADTGYVETVGCWSYRSTLEFVSTERTGALGKESEYYDLDVVTTGNKPNDAGAIVRFHERKTYHFHAGNYQLQTQGRH